LLLILLLVLADAMRCAAKAPQDYRLRAFNRWYVYLLCVVLAGLEGNVSKALITARFVQAFKIPTQSMAPTLVTGDRLLVDKFTFAPPTNVLARLLPHRDPRRGDLVVFNLALADGVTQPGEKSVKRIIGVPGDRVRIVHREVVVNGRPVDEPYVRHDPAFADELRPGDDFPPADPADLVAATTTWSAEMGSVIRDGELIVPLEKYFVLGDNREQSWDSRFWGFVPQNDIIGKPDVIYFSWNAKAHHVQWDRIGEMLK
jgi:signal peptidase I